MRRFVGILCLILHISATFSLNILGLMSLPSPSHHIWNRNVFLALAARGYNLTILSPDIDKAKTPGLHYIWAEQVYDSMYKGDGSINVLDLVGESPFKAIFSTYDWFTAACAGMYKSEGFRTLLNYPDNFKFDLILLDFNLEPCLLGFLHKFKYPPTVVLSAFSVPPIAYDFVGGHRAPSYVPHYTVESGPNMNFLKRLENYLVFMLDDWYRKNRYIPQQEELMRANFNDATMPDAATLRKKIVLVLANTHYAFEKVEPLPPNIIPVAGLQINEPKPLDADLVEFVNTSKEGFVLFSLGTNMKSEFMDETRKRAFVEAFKQFPKYNFIWKYESDLGIPLPPNVKILPWIKQNDILAHRKMRAFISHCGLLGTTEAAWFGVPVVGIPLFVDQYRNLQNGIREGASLKLEYKSLSVETITKALKTILEDPKYYQNAQRRSRLFRDQPEKPLNRAIYWIEWVLRHKDGYSAIQLPINELGVVISNSYDIIMFLCALMALFIYGLFKMYKKCTGTKIKPKSKKN